MRSYLLMSTPEYIERVKTGEINTNCPNSGPLTGLDVLLLLVGAAALMGIPTLLIHLFLG